MTKSAGNVKSLIILDSTLTQKLGSRLSESHLQTKCFIQSHSIQIEVGGHNSVVLMCEIQIVCADGCTMKARALVDLASSTSFITETLAQCLHLRRQRHSMKVGCIGGSASQLSSCGMVDLSLSSRHGKTLTVEVVVLTKVTNNLPFCSVPFSHRWKHLSNIHLADADFSSPGSVDLLLGTDVFSHTMLKGRRFGPSGSPSAFRMCFGWVLVGATHTSGHRN